jgi:hypothetical protein
MLIVLVLLIILSSVCSVGMAWWVEELTGAVQVGATEVGRTQLNNAISSITIEEGVSIFTNRNQNSPVE